MTQDNKIMITICPDINPSQGQCLHDKLVKEFPIEFVSLDGVKELLPLLSKEDFYCDYISVDLEQLYHVNNVDIFALLNTINTLLTCTLVRDENGAFVQRKTKIVILVGTKTPAEYIKEVMSLPMVSFIGLRTGDGFSDDEIAKSLRAIINNDTTIPSQVQEILSRKKKSNESKNTINLTPRQRQIFNLVANRGVSNKIIAKMLNISESTVKLHMSALLKKHKVRNRTQLAVFSKETQKENISLM
jgi:hypothetical protein